MQTIWSRVAQTRASCRCPHCISSINAVSRRANASATRRMQRYLTSSTLLYSGIFAAAATFDARVKKQRREQWDLAIADIKQELGQPAGEPRKEILDAQIQEQEEVEQDTIEFKPFEGLSQDEDAFSRLDPQKPRPRLPTNTGPPIIAFNLPPDSVYALEGMTRKWRNQSSWSDKKLENCRLSMEILQLQLFQLLHDQGWSQEAAGAVPSDFAAVILQKPEELSRQRSIKETAIRRLAATRGGAIPNHFLPDANAVLCHYVEDNAGGARRVSQELNVPIQTLFNQHAKSKITTPALLARVSHLICDFGAPPDLATFNTLLIGLSRTKHSTLVEQVIYAFRMAHIRPNEVSLASILNFFTKTNQADMFMYWIELIRGKHGGLALARSDINITETGQSRLLRKENEPNKIVQLPYPTPDVFTAVIAGVIKFTNFETAMSICQKMGQDGWGLSIDSLTPLLHDCAERADWSSGQAVWMQIQALLDISRRRDPGGLFRERVPLQTFAVMLRLCSKVGRREEFDARWKEAMIEHNNRGSSDRLMKLVVGRKKKTIVREAEEQRVQQKGDVDLQPDHNPPPRIHAPRPILRPIDTEIEYEAAQDDPAPQLAAATTHTNHDRIGLDISQLSEEQLHGTLPAGDELNEYELRERPMRIDSSIRQLPMLA